jgi:hypothetical protein
MNPWTPEAPVFGAWSVATVSDTIRVIEDGSRRRITEQGIVRIIERFDTSTTWTTIAPTSANPWLPA